MKTKNVLDWDTWMQLWLTNPDPFIRRNAKEFLFKEKLREAGLLDEYLQIFWQS